MMLINGLASNELPANDRAVQYGDGLFETIALFKGEPRAWQRHMHRLRKGCKILGILEPEISLLETEVKQLYRDYGDAQEKWVLKIIISRGSTGRGYRVVQKIPATRILALYPWPEHAYKWSEVGIRMHVCETRLACNPALAGIKHLNRIENILASNEWQDSDIAEGLMRNMHGDVIEGTMTNIFAVFDGQLRTPILKYCGVEGTMRARIIDAAIELGINVDECRIGLDELYQADELFMCNSILNIVPVRQLGDHQYTINGNIMSPLSDASRHKD